MNSHADADAAVGNGVAVVVDVLGETTMKLVEEDSAVAAAIGSDC